jgi:hypothetical protein
VADYSSEREDRGLDVSFRITRHSRLEPQESEITVWGLSAPTRDRIARAVEPSLGYRHQLPGAAESPTVGRAMSNAACDLAEALGARAILVPTFTGRTASAVARLRPRRPIVVTWARFGSASAARRKGLELLWRCSPRRILPD